MFNKSLSYDEPLSTMMDKNTMKLNPNQIGTGEKKDFSPWNG